MTRPAQWPFGSCVGCGPVWGGWRRCRHYPVLKGIFIMRVIAGSARRLLLTAPPGLETRPTQDKIKETLFNILQMQVPGSVFLDICAGSGGIGIEAISRGARRAYFVENGRAAISCIQQNLHKTGFEDKAVILRQDAVAALRQVHEKEVDLVYLDPPYRSDLPRRILTALDGQSYITQDTCIVVETDYDSDFSFLEETGLEIYREKNYRGNRHLFIRRRTQE
ncbi:MAG: 16S rRNA (guanine(966)-N(2))-methyltransferase RsmD [Lachnospiraceae bacterium]|nr:16S rRNA (guanine(966)-N(2))-methyltransferase RsmD [Lachnospiraceae bacterium]MEE1162825.1 16S rRNA (guanine(966)-N(2))-methyltransferase RsmD [Lachnospiraceae bacterium]